MATSLVTFNSMGIPASSSPSSSRKPSTQSRKPSSQSEWLSPIFGWSNSSKADNSESSSDRCCSSGGDAAGESGEERKGRWRYTDEKTRQLRMMTTGLDMSHEKMYHSAIAPRLASDFSNRFVDDLI